MSITLAAAVVALYWPATANDFVSLDDPNYVFGNRHVLGGCRGTACAGHSPRSMPRPGIR